MTVDTGAVSQQQPEINPPTNIPRSPTELGVDILAEHSVDAPEDLGGLFSDEERPSTVDLGGEGEPPKEEAPKQEEKKAEPESPPQEKKEEAKKPPETATPEPKGDEKKGEEKKPEEKKEEQGKPPEGYVPKQALAEARGQIKALKAEIETLKVQKPQEQASPATNEDVRWRDFKVLTLEEYEQMVDDDPTTAVKYDRKLREYEKYQDRKERQQLEAKEQSVKMKVLVEKSMEEIDQVVPGIYDDDKGPEIRKTLATFATDNGFDNADYLAVLTNPETRVVPPGSDQSYLIGPGAKGIVALLNNLRNKLASADPGKLRDEITKEIEPKLRETITKELITKFKGTKGDAFKSLTQVPGSGDAPEARRMTEAEWAKLSQEERDKLLGA